MARFPSIFFSAAALLSLVASSACKKSPESSVAEAPYSPYHEVPGATYVGAQNCRACHEQEFGEWQESDHHRAMEPATEETVEGDFNDAEFEHFGHVTRFYRKGDEFWVNTEDENGERKDYQIEYTFGFEPLQQYLIAFPGGRYQALQVCWDSRPKEEGGQRWYHLYPDEEVPPGDLLHWTGRHFNWNFMCADCHSTNLKKNFDDDADTYDTTWSEMNVSCEACHGPGSEHLKWAEADAAEKSGKPGDYDALTDYLNGKGLVVTLKEPETAGWAIDEATLKPKRTTPLKSNVQVDTCARCHAHRQLLEPEFTAGKPFLDTHVPSILSDRLYHHDGQINEEVYVYGSFVQSKMYHSGVRCTDCHHPHTMKPLAPGNALCVRCHLPQNYDTPAHHFHPVESTGAQCVECHMPEKTYMGVDDRRDHSLRIPRPDLSKKLGTPNACTNCHEDKGLDWNVAAFEERWGKGPRNAHYGEILAAGRQAAPSSMQKLIDLAADFSRPALVRATAIQALSRHFQPSQETVQAIAVRLEDPDPMVRREALTALDVVQPAQRLQLAVNLLADPSRAVRTEAARLLAPAAGMMDAPVRESFDRAAAEFIEKQKAVNDRGAGHMAMALFYTDLGQPDKAEAAYRKAIKVEPDQVPPRVNLAEMLYNRGQIEEAEKLFRSAVEFASLEENRGLAHDALARFLIRQKRHDEGIVELEKAARLQPTHAQAQYFYGVALNSVNRFAEALPFLQKAQELEPNHAEYLSGLATICRDAGEWDLALQYAQKLAALNPNDEGVQQLLEQIRSQVR